MSDNPVPVPAEPVEPLTVAAYVHWTPDSGQVPAPEPGNYYVSVVDSGRTGLLLGPFTQHVTALGWVDACRAHAEQVDPWRRFTPSARSGWRTTSPGQVCSTRRSWRRQRRAALRLSESSACCQAGDPPPANQFPITNRNVPGARLPRALGC